MKMAEPLRNLNGRLVTYLFVPLLIVVGSAAWGAQTCTTATIDEPISLPDGSAHPPGKLTVCVHRDFSPVSSLHMTYVNRRPVAMLMSRRGVSEGQAERPFMMFRRIDGGRLQLYGYALPSRQHMTTYLLSAPASSRQPVLQAGTASDPQNASKLLLAARTP